MFADFDFDGSGEIIAMSSSATYSDTIVFVYARDGSVQKWDTDGSGELSFQEFQAILSLGFAVPYPELLHVFEEIDRQSGTVSFQSCTDSSAKVPPSVG